MTKIIDEQLHSDQKSALEIFNTLRSFPADFMTEPREDEPPQGHNMSELGAEEYESRR
jgi:hypothetical protein